MIWAPCTNCFREFTLLPSRVTSLPVKSLPRRLGRKSWETSSLRHMAGLPRIGECLIFIYEDKREGLWPFRLGRTEGNEALIASPRSLPPFSLEGMDEEDLLNIMQGKGQTTS